MEPGRHGRRWRPVGGKRGSRRGAIAEIAAMPAGGGGAGRNRRSGSTGGTSTGSARGPNCAGELRPSDGQLLRYLSRSAVAGIFAALAVQRAIRVPPAMLQHRDLRRAGEKRRGPLGLRQLRDRLGLR